MKCENRVCRDNYGRRTNAVQRLTLVKTVKGATKFEFKPHLCGRCASELIANQNWVKPEVTVNV